MAAEALEFYLTPGVTLEHVSRKLGLLGELRRSIPQVSHRTFFDTFDWRLFLQGTSMEETRADGYRHVIWRNLGSGAPLNKMEGAAPRFVRDLPDGTLRDRLEPILEMRALLPAVTVETRVQSISLLNKEGKTVVRLSLEENRAHSMEDDSSQPLRFRVRVIPIRGYDAFLRQALDFLRAEKFLTPASEDLLVEALEALGRSPGSYSSKFLVPLDRNMTSEQAARKILLTLLQSMEANAEGTRKGLDTEFLHDFRVAGRRTRSALSEINGVFPPEAREHFQSEFAWLGSVTGPTRDLDVYLLKFAEYQATIPEAFQQDLAPLREYLVQLQIKEQATLAEELLSPRYQTLIAEWRAFLESSDWGALPSNAGRPVRDVAGKRIWKVYRRTLREGRAIDEQSPPDQLHELRKTCKILRYLLEFFRSLYPRKELRRLIKALKMLQDNLGDFQDLHVQSETLRRFGDQMGREGGVPAVTFLAMGMLIDKLLQRQQRARSEFSQRFRDFSRRRNHDLFSLLFRPARRKETDGS